MEKFLSLELYCGGNRHIVGYLDGTREVVKLFGANVRKQQSSGERISIEQKKKK